MKTNFLRDGYVALLWIPNDVIKLYCWFENKYTWFGMDFIQKLIFIIAVLKINTSHEDNAFKFNAWLQSLVEQ